jgi:hypothetical protein
MGSRQSSSFVIGYDPDEGAPLEALSDQELADLRFATWTEENRRRPYPRRRSELVRLYVRDSGGAREFVRDMELPGAPLEVPAGYVVIFREEEIRGRDTVEIEFGVPAPIEAE